MPACCARSSAVIPRLTSADSSSSSASQLCRPRKKPSLLRPFLLRPLGCPGCGWNRSNRSRRSLERFERFERLEAQGRGPAAGGLG